MVPTPPASEPVHCSAGLRCGRRASFQAVRSKGDHCGGDAASPEKQNACRAGPDRRLYFVATSGPVLGRRIPVQSITTTAMPNWEEEEFGVALKQIWCSSCCIAIGIFKILYLLINFLKSLLFNVYSYTSDSIT